MKANAENCRITRAAVDGILRLLDELRVWPIDKRAGMRAGPVGCSMPGDKNATLSAACIRRQVARY
jgi:hypothetical protein